MHRYTTILDEITQTLSHVTTTQAQQFIAHMTTAPAVYVAAKGRSGLVGQGFAMRLNQLGQRAYVVGEVVTPPIKEGDVLLIISGSGSTTHLKILAEQAQKRGAQIILVSTKDESPIADMASTVVVLPSGTKYDATGSVQPLGSLFEQSSQIFLDAVVMDMMAAMHVDETVMQQNHANLE